jgi:hypothetical protein
MDLHGVNLFTPFLFPVLPYLEPETFLLEDALGLMSVLLTWSKFHLGLSAKVGFSVFSGAATGFHAGFA